MAATKSLIPVAFPVDRLSVESTFNTFLVVSLGYWGRGESIKEALKNLKKQGAKAADKKLLYWGTDDLDITTTGYVSASNMVSLGEI